MNFRAPYDQRAGVLSLQGNFQAHLDLLSTLGYPSLPVRSRQDLEAVDSLIIPGGESTTILKLMERYELRDLIIKRFEQGMAIFATCAGAIVLAEKVNNGEPPLGLLPIEITRNAYGRQVDSFETDIPIAVLGTSVRGIFIRAPAITAVGEGVEVLASWADAPVLVQSNRILASTFHPELAGETRLHKYFIEQVAAGPQPVLPGSGVGA